MLNYFMFSKRRYAAFAFLFFFSCSNCEEEPSPTFSTRQALPGEDGAKCFFDTECDSGKCDTSFHLGYCSSENCDASCFGEDAFCLTYLSEKEQCVDGCNTSAECRNNYDCIQVYENKSVCLPKKHLGPTSGQLGAACDEKDCYPGFTCLDVNEKGYCAGDCQDCEGEFCGKIDGKEYCLAACAADAECQLDDKCIEGACYPQASMKTSFSKMKDLFAMQCEAKKVGEFTYEFGFSLQPETEAFSITLLSTNSNFKILEIEKDGAPFGISTTYRHHNQRLLNIERYPFQSGYFGAIVFDWTVLVPYAPQFEDYVDTNAEYIVRVESPVDLPCLYLLETKGGTKLTLDLYFATELFSAQSASTNKDLGEILSTLKTLYANAGIEISDIRYHDLSDEQKERFSTISSSDVAALTTLGKAQGESLEDHLSVDLFMVDDILSGALGVSPSIPGPPGMHGNRKNGLVFSVVDAGFDNEVIGYIMAHEIGHYLGLRHSAEQLVGETREYIDRVVGVKDPILDTPSCLDVDGECPDKDNLMFPTIPDIDDRIGKLSEGQREALQANPLLRE